MNNPFQLFPILLAETVGSEGASHTTPVWIRLLFVAIIFSIVIGLTIFAQTGLNERIFKNPVTSWAEQLYLFLEQFAVGVIGPHGRKYMPMLATYWLFIFVSCIFGLFFAYTPTADLSLNLGLALTAVAYVQYEGIRVNGLGGHIKHFAGPKMVGGLVLVSGLIFLIEIISEAMKILSLSLRLYGNIHGGHKVVESLNDQAKFMIGGHETHIPIGGILLPIKLLTCIVQALVFTLLFSVYLGLATHHEEEASAH